MVTADTTVPFRPDFFPAVLCGRKPLVAVYSIIEEYVITGNVLLLRTFASQQIPENPLSGCTISTYCGALKSLIPFIIINSVVDGYNGTHFMRLRLGRFLHGSAGCRVEPCFDRLLSFHLRRCPVPALVGLGRQRVSTAFLDDRIDNATCRIQQAHLSHRGNIGALPVFPQAKTDWAIGEVVSSVACRAFVFSFPSYAVMSADVPCSTPRLSAKAFGVISHR